MACELIVELPAEQDVEEWLTPPDAHQAVRQADDDRDGGGVADHVWSLTEIAVLLDSS